MGALQDIVAWAVVIVLVGAGMVAAVRDARRDRARRRSVVAGRAIRYGPAGSYRPRSALWTGLLFAWIGSSITTALPIAGLLPQPWRAEAIAGAVGAAVIAFVVAARFLLDHIGTDVVEGRVLERKIIRSGEHDEVSNYWIAVDDGERIACTPVGHNDHVRVVAGARVRLHLTPRGRQLKRLEVIELPGPVNAFPGELPHLFRRGADDLLISAAQAARALGSPVELTAVVSDVPDTRSYTYVSSGTRMVNGIVSAPALHVTEAFNAEAANELGRRVTEGRGRAWHHGSRDIFRAGLTYLMTWGDGGLLIRGQIADMDQASTISHLVYTLRPPKPGRSSRTRRS